MSSNRCSCCGGGGARLLLGAEAGCRAGGRHFSGRGTLTKALVARTQIAAREGVAAGYGHAPQRRPARVSREKPAYSARRNALAKSGRTSAAGAVVGCRAATQHS